MKLGTFMLVLAVILAAVLGALMISPELGRLAGIFALAAVVVLAITDVGATKAAKADKPRAGRR